MTVETTYTMSANASLLSTESLYGKTSIATDSTCSTSPIRNPPRKSTKPQESDGDSTSHGSDNGENPASDDGSDATHKLLDTTLSSISDEMDIEIQKHGDVLVASKTGSIEEPESIKAKNPKSSARQRLLSLLRARRRQNSSRTPSTANASPSSSTNWNLSRKRAAKWMKVVDRSATATLEESKNDDFAGARNAALDGSIEDSGDKQITMPSQANKGKPKLFSSRLFRKEKWAKRTNRFTSSGKGSTPPTKTTPTAAENMQDTTTVVLRIDMSGEILQERTRSCPIDLDTDEPYDYNAGRAFGPIDLDTDEPYEDADKENKAPNQQGEHDESYDAHRETALREPLREENVDTPFDMSLLTERRQPMLLPRSRSLPTWLLSKNERVTKSKWFATGNDLKPTSEDRLPKAASGKFSRISMCGEILEEEAEQPLTFAVYTDSDAQTPDSELPKEETTLAPESNGLLVSSTCDDVISKASETSWAKTSVDECIDSETNQSISLETRGAKFDTVLTQHQSMTIIATCDTESSQEETTGAVESSPADVETTAQDTSSWLQLDAADPISDIETPTILVSLSFADYGEAVEATATIDEFDCAESKSSVDEDECGQQISKGNLRQTNPEISASDSQGREAEEASCLPTPHECCGSKTAEAETQAPQIDINVSEPKQDDLSSMGELAGSANEGDDISNTGDSVDDSSVTTESGDTDPCHYCAKEEPIEVELMAYGTQATI